MPISISSPSPPPRPATAPLASALAMQRSLPDYRPGRLIACPQERQEGP